MAGAGARNGNGDYIKIPRWLVAILVTTVAALFGAWLKVHLNIAEVDKKVDILQVYQTTDHELLQEVREDVKSMAVRLGVPTSNITASPTQDALHDSLLAQTE